MISLKKYWNAYQFWFFCLKRTRKLIKIRALKTTIKSCCYNHLQFYLFQHCDCFWYCQLFLFIQLKWLRAILIFRLLSFKLRRWLNLLKGDSLIYFLLVQYFEIFWKSNSSNEFFIFSLRAKPMIWQHIEETLDFF